MEQGNSLNTLNGEIKLLNSLFTKKDKQLQIYDFSVLAENQSGSDHLQLRSDFVDADLTGNYELTEINKSFRHFLNTICLPWLIREPLTCHAMHNSFNLKANLKNAKPVVRFLSSGILSGGQKQSDMFLQFRQTKD